MKIKRGIAAAMAALAGAGMLAGCGSSSSSTTTAASGSTTAASGSTTAASGSSSSSSGSVSLTFAWWGNQTRNERTSSAIELYEQENSNVTIDGQFSEWTDYWQKMATAAAGGQSPDIMQQDYQYITQYANSDQLLDLTPYIEDGTLDASNWDESMLEAGTVDGKIVAICAGMNAPSMVYNKTITDEAGVTIKDNMTLDEFIEAAKTVYEKTGYKTDLSYGTVQEFFNYLLRSDDVILFGDTQINATAEQLTKYFQVYEDGINEGWELGPDVYADITIGSIEQAPIVAGSSPETSSWNALIWSNQYTAMNALATEDMDLELTTWPSPDPVKSDFIKPGQFFSVTTDSENPEEAVKFLNYLINDEDCNDILLGERGVPINSEIADRVKSQLDETDQKIYDFVYNVVQPNSSTINPPYPDGYSEAGTNLNDIVEELCYGQIDASEAAEEFITMGSASLAAKAS
ncbi:MAG: ABC transporter substrate-binding protein [Lachnospiraceae bacterium]|jgi:multiple sugar transport system substrate-binding protein